MTCDFSNDKFMSYIKELRKKHKNKNYNFGYNELLKFITINLKDDSKIKKILSKKEFDTKDMRILNDKCSGIVNLELSGYAKIVNNKVHYIINKNHSYLDLRNKVPNCDADITKNITWHMHPWNISLDYKNDVPSFFSYEDLRIAVNFPTKKFIIFNMNCEEPKIPCVYFVWACKNVKKNKAKKVISDLYSEIYERLLSGDYTIDFEKIKQELAKIDVHFYYLYRYAEKSFVKILKEK